MSKKNDSSAATKLTELLQSRTYRRLMCFISIVRLLQPTTITQMLFHLVYLGNHINDGYSNSFRYTGELFPRTFHRQQSVLYFPWLLDYSSVLFLLTECAFLYVMFMDPENSSALLLASWGNYFTRTIQFYWTYRAHVFDVGDGSLLLAAHLPTTYFYTFMILWSVQSYFISAIQKWRYSGLKWCVSSILKQTFQDFPHFLPDPVMSLLTRFDLLLYVMQTKSWLLEFTSVFMLTSLHKYYAIGFFLFHLGIAMTTKIIFSGSMAVAICIFRIPNPPEDDLLPLLLLLLVGLTFSAVYFEYDAYPIGSWKMFCHTEFTNRSIDLMTVDLDDINCYDNGSELAGDNRISLKVNGEDYLAWFLEHSQNVAWHHNAAFPSLTNKNHLRWFLEPEIQRKAVAHLQGKETLDLERLGRETMEITGCKIDLMELKVWTVSKSHSFSQADFDAVCG